jgi:RHS repeat-associated protein
VRLADGTWVEYLIDATNRRIGKRVNGVTVQKFLYSGDLRIVAELDSSDQVVARYVYAGRENVPEYMVRGGTTYRLVLDHLGSVRLVVDASTGAVAQRLDYDEYGRVLLDTHAGLQPFGFAGGLYDELTGLVRFGARDYDAETGRWTAKDPIGFEGGSLGLFVYNENDPVNRTDPDGRISFNKKLAVVSASLSALNSVVSGILQGQSPRDIIESAVTSGLFALAGTGVTGNVGLGLISGSVSAAVGSYFSPRTPYAGLDFALSVLAGGIVGALTAGSSGDLVDDALSLTLRVSLAQMAFQVGFHSAVNRK